MSEQAWSASQPSDYWDSILAGWEPTLAHRLWRAHSDAVNARLLRRWLVDTPADGKILKTDLFDEAVAGGLYPELAARGGQVIGVDVAPAVVRAACARHPGLDARVADVRALPFDDGEFDAVVSNSTLDHFDSLAELVLAASELSRVIRPGGRLLITLDNRQNPIVALRTSLSFSAMRRLRIVPYYVGRTLGRRGLAATLERCGLDVQQTTAVMHCPPKLAGAYAARGARSTLGSQQTDRYLARVLRLESLESSPVRYFTGHFVAALAVKPGHGAASPAVA
ncbi:MAG: class I SAM-dependent methyltransferase [Solirubrobacteraceae bacterium]